MSCLSCKKKLKDDLRIISLEEIAQREKQLRPISHEKSTRLGKRCYHDRLMVKLYEKWVPNAWCG